MATSVGLNFRLTAAVDKFEAGMKDVEKRLNGIERSSKQTASGMKILASIEVGKILVGGLTKVFSIMKTGVSSVTSLAKEAAAAADAIGKLSASTGVAAEPLQVFQKLAEDNGISGDKLGEALKRMTKRVAEAKMGFGEALPALKQLGLNVDDLANMKPEQAFLKIGAAIGELPQKGAQAAAAFKIFSDQGLAMVPMFADMEKNVKATADELLDLGAVLSGTQIKNIETMNTRWQTVYETIKKIGTQVLGNLAPLITQMAEDALALVKAFEYNGNQGGQALANYLTDAMFDGAEMLAGVYDDAKDFFATFVIDLGHWLDDFGKWVARFTDMTWDGSSVDMTMQNFHSDIAKSLQEQARSLNSQLSNMEMLNVMTGGLSEDAELQSALARQRNKLMEEARDAESSYMSERKKSLVGETSMVQTLADLRAKREQTENEQRAALNKLTQETEKTAVSTETLAKQNKTAESIMSFFGKATATVSGVLNSGPKAAVDALSNGLGKLANAAGITQQSMEQLKATQERLNAIEESELQRRMGVWESAAAEWAQRMKAHGANPFEVDKIVDVHRQIQQKNQKDLLGMYRDTFTKNEAAQKAIEKRREDREEAAAKREAKRQAGIEARLKKREDLQDKAYKDFQKLTDIGKSFGDWWSDWTGPEIEEVKPELEKQTPILDDIRKAAENFGKNFVVAPIG